MSEPTAPALGDVTPATLEDAAADFAPPTGAADDDPALKDSAEAEGSFERAVAEADRGDDGHAVVHLLRAAKLAEAAREWYLAAVAFHRIGDIYRTPEPPYDLERALRMYRRAVAAYDLCGHFDDARDLTYRIMWMKMTHGRELKLAWQSRAELAVFWLLAGFGYRPQRVAAFGLGVVLVFAALFWAIGGALDPATGRPIDFWGCVYFSGVTFTTVGYGDLLPAPHARFLALAEAALGAFGMGFFVVVLANRLRH